jgi:hypothetical protein
MGKRKLVSVLFPLTFSTVQFNHTKKKEVSIFPKNKQNKENQITLRLNLISLFGFFIRDY